MYHESSYLEPQTDGPKLKVELVNTRELWKWNNRVTRTDILPLL